MDLENLLQLFNSLLSVTQSRVDECKSQNRVPPRMMLVTRHKVEEMRTTETGPRPSRYRDEHAFEPEWRPAEIWVFEQLKSEPAYLSFCAEVSRSTGNEICPELDDIIRLIVRGVFQNTPFDNQESLKLLLTAIQGRPVPAWSDVDVWGILLKTKVIDLNLGKSSLLFRQLDTPDFEQEFVYGLADPVRNFPIPVDSVLRIQIETSRNMELQLETDKVLVLLRLLNVCSVDFAQEVHQTSNPFASVGPAHIGGTLCHGQVRHGRHSLTLADCSKEKILRFWEAVEPRLPREMHDIGLNKTSYLTIAYQRYCDGLFTSTPIEQKIAAAIMGLEALYFGPGDMQELTYRLALRVSKALSNLDIDAKEIQSQMKIGYKIRSLHVHGSCPSSRDWKNVQKTGLSPEHFATKLLDYLRMSILHLVCSQQTKTQFLDLVEESLISPTKNESLREILQNEKEILRLEFP